MSALLDQLIEPLTSQEAWSLTHATEFDWKQWARPAQLPPAGEWDVWALVCGRGSGKTRCGSEWVISYARKNPGCRIALVGRTAADVRDTMVLGESGILPRSPKWFPRARYIPTKRVVSWENGSQAFMFSAEKPDMLRGPQFHAAWGDEFAAWKRVKDEKGGDAWSNLQDSLRLGKRPQALLTTTPRPTALVLDTFLGPRDERGKRRVSAEQAKTREWEFAIEMEDRFHRRVVHRTVVRRWSTEENALNLAPGFSEKRRAKYAGSRLGAQELDAEFLTSSDVALWTQDLIDDYRAEEMASRERMVVAIDPTRSQWSPRDECGIVAACRGKDGHVYVLEDATLKAAPYDWAMRALSIAQKYGADEIVYESSGLDQSIRDTLRTVAAHAAIRWKAETARGDKKARAEPVSALYRAGRVHHVGMFEFLEDEMITWDPSSKWSPNRLDALVWAVTDLLLTKSSAEIVSPLSLTKTDVR